MKNPFIWTEQSNLQEEFCTHCISKFETDDRKHKGIVGNGFYNSKLKRSLDLAISNLEDWKEEDNIFYNSITKSYNQYWEYLNSTVPNSNGIVDIMNNNDNVGDAGYQIQKTEPNEFYDWHNDASVIGPKVRAITFIWYLNTINEKGYTEFWDGTKIKPEIGKLLLFPATWNFIHRGVSPKKQTKYICTGWLHYNVNLSTDK